MSQPSTPVRALSVCTAKCPLMMPTSFHPYASPPPDDLSLPLWRQLDVPMEHSVYFSTALSACILPGIGLPHLQESARVKPMFDLIAPSMYKPLHRVLHYQP